MDILCTERVEKRRELVTAPLTENRLPCLMALRLLSSLQTELAKISFTIIYARAFRQTVLVLVPVDCYTDCMDVWGLVCSARGLSNDKTQRLVILGLREYRRYGLIRATITFLHQQCLQMGLQKFVNSYNYFVTVQLGE